jgi:hypothetical protein
MYSNALLENEEFLEKWKKSNKSQKKVSIMDEKWSLQVKKCLRTGISQASFELEFLKLILIAKDCIEKGEKIIQHILYLKPLTAPKNPTFTY